MAQTCAERRKAKKKANRQKAVTPSQSTTIAAKIKADKASSKKKEIQLTEAEFNQVMAYYKVLRGKKEADAAKNKWANDLETHENV